MRTARRYLTNRQRGFTLVETLIVIMYIAIIATIVIPNVTGVGRQASETNLHAVLRELRSAIGAYQAETGLYPRTLDDLVTWDAPAMGLTEGGVEVPIHPGDFRGPYLMVSGQKLPVDRTTGERTWDYSTAPPDVGAVHSLNSNTSMNGAAYSTF
jgi:general secretion pathway protein G